ncbi:MAG: hypothetical protein QM586_12890 [Xenophilus sp.]
MPLPTFLAEDPPTLRDNPPPAPAVLAGAVFGKSGELDGFFAHGAHDRPSQRGVLA